MNYDLAAKINWFLLGALMLIAGLLKLFVVGSAGVTGMLSGLGFPAAAFFAWVLIIGEIGSGVAILARWKLQYVVWIPIIILVLAAFTANWGNWTGLVLHLVAASNYLLLGASAARKKK